MLRVVEQPPQRDRRVLQSGHERDSVVAKRSDLRQPARPRKPAHLRKVRLQVAAHPASVAYQEPRCPRIKERHPHTLLKKLGTDPKARPYPAQDTRTCVLAMSSAAPRPQALAPQCPSWITYSQAHSPQSLARESTKVPLRSATNPPSCHHGRGPWEKPCIVLIYREGFAMPTMRRRKIEWKWEDPDAQQSFLDWAGEGGWPSREKSASEVDEIERLACRALLRRTARSASSFAASSGSGSLNCSAALPLAGWDSRPEYRSTTNLNVEVLVQLGGLRGLLSGSPKRRRIATTVPSPDQAT